MELRMSRIERDRLKVIEQVERGMISQMDAARVLKLSTRQVRRLQGRYRAEGDRGLIHRLRGRRSNRRISEAARSAAIERIETRYRDFGPTLAAEYLADEAAITVSRETVRGWMIEAGVWRGSRPRRPHRRRRPRRRCLGELVQMDTSIHDWFEGRGESAVLIAMIDDATSRVMPRFFASDTTAANMTLLRDYIERHGRPLALYTDWASHFKHTPNVKQRRAAERRRTQIERALGELGIELIAARSPQAKGRVERRLGVAQDRLVKALRLNNISTISAANRFIERVYEPRINAKFSVTAAEPADVHGAVEGFDLDAIFSIQHPRRVANDCTVRLDGQTYQIEAGATAPGLAGSRVTLERRLDSTMRLRWGDRYLRYRRLGPTAPSGKKEQPVADPSVGPSPPSRSATKKIKPYIPPHDHPWRRTFLPGKKPDNSTLR